MSRRTCHIHGSGLALAIVLALCLSGRAQTKSGFEIGLAGSVGLPQNQLGDRTNQGYGGSFGLTHSAASASSGAVAFGLNVTYDFLPADRDGRADLTFLAGGLSIRLSLADPQGDHIYLLMIGGWSRVKWGEHQVERATITGVTENGPYVSPGIGLLYRRTKLSPFFQLEYVVVSGKRIGNYEFLRFSAGARW